jgi:competence ComEA-like helix-hairpin-helix protein
MAERETNPGHTGRDPALRVAQSLAFLVGMGICLVLSLGFAAEMLQRPGTVTAVPSGERINPNEAPVASLMRLPQIGLARARAIVAQRESAGPSAGRAAAFQRVDDLQQIKGIGPAIVEGVRPWLEFDAATRDSNELPGK